MLSTKMFLSHFDGNKPTNENTQPNTMPKSSNKINKRVLQPKSTNIKPNHNSLSSKSSIKDFFADVPNVKCERKRKLEIFDETIQTAKKSKTIATQTSPDALELTCSETPSDKYWELLAEERRKALHEALNENKQLADDIERKDEKIKDLENEVKTLEKTSSQAEYLASVIEQLGEECLKKDIEEATANSCDQVSTENTIDETDTCEVRLKKENKTDGDENSGDDDPSVGRTEDGNNKQENHRPVSTL